MTGLRVITSGGADTFLDAATVQDFAARLCGSLLRHGDDGYDEARKLFNGMIDHRPALIARCVGAADVIAAVQFVRQHALLVSIKGGWSRRRREGCLRRRFDDRLLAHEEYPRRPD
jgi:hypothetical protein